LGSEKEIEHIPLVDAPIFRLHGDLTQVERNESTNKFRSAKSGVLLATDVAARGLDFPDLDWIVQFDPPSDTKVALYTFFCSFVSFAIQLVTIFIPKVS
jgi:superfamily II DNA helicase RecQ